MYIYIWLLKSKSLLFKFSIAITMFSNFIKSKCRTLYYFANNSVEIKLVIEL